MRPAKCGAPRPPSCWVGGWDKETPIVWSLKKDKTGEQSEEGMLAKETWVF